MSRQVEKNEYEVVWPIGKSTVKPKTLAPSIPDLNGKKICMVWKPYGKFKGEVTFPELQELLQKQFPNVKIVPFTGLPKGDDDIKKVIAAVKESGCDAVIGGNGG
jgi:hypothetical protein